MVICCHEIVFHLITMSIKEYSLQWLILPHQVSGQNVRALLENVLSLKKKCNKDGRRGTNCWLIIPHSYSHASIFSLILACCKLLWTYLWNGPPAVVWISVSTEAESPCTSPDLQSSALITSAMNVKISVWGYWVESTWLLICTTWVDRLEVLHNFL